MKSWRTQPASIPALTTAIDSSLSPPPGIESQQWQGERSIVIANADARCIPLRDRCVQCVVTSPPYWGQIDYGYEGGVGMETNFTEYLVELLLVFREVRRVLRDDGALWLNLGDCFKNKQLFGLPWKVAFALQQDGWLLRTDIVWHKPNPMPEAVYDRPTRSHEFVFLLTKQPRYLYDYVAIMEDSKEGERRNARDVWTLSTQSFKGVSFYGSYRITSPDCSDHGCLACLARALRCGELRVSFDPVRSLDSGSRRARVQEGVAYAIRRDQCESLACMTSATSHSILIRRMAAVLGQGGTCDDTRVFDRWCMGLLHHSCATFGHMRGSKTWLGASSDARHSDPSERTSPDIVGIYTSSSAPPCSCQHIGRVENRQDHFACFPERLVEPCVRAGTSEKGACPMCGAAWIRRVEKQRVPTRPGTDTKVTGDGAAEGNRDPLRHVTRTATIGWAPQCRCSVLEKDVEPQLVLDPFCGSGTVGVVCKRLGREFIGLDLKMDYCKMALKRVGAA